MLVRDVMGRATYTVRQDQLIDPVAAQMNARGLADAPVVDRHGVLVGLLSAEDLLYRWISQDETPRRWDDPEDPDPQPQFVGEIMERGVPTVGRADDVADIARLMVELDLRCVPVVEDGRLQGVVSRRDVLRTVVRTDETLRLEAQHRLDAYTGGVRCWEVTVLDGTATVRGPAIAPGEARIVTIMVESVPGVRRAEVLVPSPAVSHPPAGAHAAGRRTGAGTTLVTARAPETYLACDT